MVSPHSLIDARERRDILGRPCAVDVRWRKAKQSRECIWDGDVYAVTEEEDMSKKGKTGKSSDAGDRKTFIEEIEVASADLVDQVKGWIEDATVSKVIIRKENGDTMLEVPVAVGGAAAGVLTLFAPVLAAIGAMAALVAKVKVDIVREPGDKDG